MRSRVPSAQPVTIGYVRERRLVFHKRSHDGSAKADATLTAVSTDRIWGVVYRLPQHEKPVLDRHEFLGIGYDQEEVEVVVENGTLRAWMYVARREAIDPSLLPYTWYRDYLLHGARQHGLPASYIDFLKSFDSLPDPDTARRARNRRLIDPPSM